MFLAIKEMRYSKLRYGLIIGIMLLIAYVVFMLSGLARGLAEEFKKAIDDWDAQEIILSEDANKTFAASQLTRNDIFRIDNSETAPIGLYSGAIDDEENKINISVFGTNEDAFILPKVTEGTSFRRMNDIIISQNLAEKGYKIGDEVKIGNSDEVLTIVGIFPETFYTVTPVIYTSLDTWSILKFGDQPFTSEEEQPINIIAVKTNQGTINNDGKTKLEKLSKDDFIESIPGYSAQNLTLDAMVYFLFFVVAAVVGIFMYVITLQKTNIFGVMKAQGISNTFIAKSIVGQSLMVGLIGVAAAFVLAYLTSFILPEAMPFAIMFDQWFIYSGILILVAVLGGLFSVHTVTKVDPITAIGG
ncbi:ABC transporter permease [Jeotgalibaca ciconiae]|uniref:Putative hemin transport system permease protein HrtB n=1 Tax=Jeotgalibaca ciconiae TaxID=2496265 RepID=A0A3S9HDY0_9LACT|nr:ABC transporter permease [Jeotgalibaca ciconiae]AZP05585.1 ABC transporter permease [Jeotgalibaca ciconiae]